MKEFSEYFGLELANFSTDWLKDKIALNSGRNSLRYIIKAYKIKKIAVPSYTCSSVWNSLKVEGCELSFYQVDKNLMPTTEFKKDDFILYNNYFGVSSLKIEKLKKKYKNLIIDNTQALFSSQKCLASFYSLRKFFGVPDGGLAWCDIILKENFETSISYHLCIHLLKSYDTDYNSSYINFMKNEIILDKQPIKKISNLTKNLLKNVNYEEIKKIRLNNFYILHNELKYTNELKIDLTDDDIPMVYPYLIKNGSLRNRLITNNVKLISCWHNIEKFASEDVLYLKKYLLPLPLDQRYNKNDMENILKIIKQ